MSVLNFLILTFFLSVSHSQDIPQFPDVSSFISDSLSQTSFGQEVLTVMGKINNWLLSNMDQGIVLTLLKEFGIDTENPSFKQFQNFEFDINTLPSKVTSLIPKLVPIVVILVLLILLTLVFFFSCISFLCCRGCGNWCAKVKKKKKEKSDVVKIIILFVLVAAFTVILFLIGFAVLVSGVSFTENFTPSNSTSAPPIINKVISSLDKIKQFISYIIKSIKYIFNVDDLMIRTDQAVDGVADILLKGLNRNCSGCSNINANLFNLNKTVMTIKEKTELVKKTQNNLLILYDSLNSTVDGIKELAIPILINCSLKCSINLGIYNNFFVLRNSSFFNNINLDQFDKLNSSEFNQLSQGPSGIIKDAIDPLKNFSDIMTDIFVGINKTLDDLENQFATTIDPYIDTSTSLWKQIIDISKQIGNIMKILALVLCSPIFVIVLFNILALILAPICSNSRNQTSEQLFVVSAQSALSLGFINCLLAFVFFLLFSVLYSQFCIDFLKYSDSKFFKFADKLAENSINDFFPINTSGFSINANFSEVNLLTGVVFEDCKKNSSLVGRILDKLDLEELPKEMIEKNFDGLFDEIKNFDFTNLEIFSKIQALNNTAEEIDLIKIPTILFVPGVNVTSIPISVMIRVTNDSYFKTNEEDLKNIRDTNLTYVEKLSNMTSTEENNLRDQLISLNDSLIGNNSILSLADQVRNLVKELEALKNSLTSSENLTDKIEDDVRNNLTLELGKVFDDYKLKLNSSLKCKPLYDIVSTLLQVVCKDIFYPGSALWIGLASSGIVFIFLVPLSLCLGGLVARKKKIPKDDSGPQSSSNKPEVIISPPKNSQAPQNPNTSPSYEEDSLWHRLYYPLISLKRGGRVDPVQGSPGLINRSYFN